MQNLIKVCLIIIAVHSTALRAASYQYNNYSLDGNIVTNNTNGLQWMQWSTTKGQSINEALSSYQSSGWKLASNQQMAGLLTDFSGGFTFTETENTFQGTNAIPSELALGFQRLFGLTYSYSYSGSSYYSSATKTYALFGSDNDKDDYFNMASSVYYKDDNKKRECSWTGYCYNTWETKVTTGLSIFSDHESYAADSKINWSGIALVKDMSSVSAVPVPASAWLFMPALLGLISLRKRFS